MALPNEKRILSREAYDRPITFIYSNQQSKGNIYQPELLLSPWQYLTTYCVDHTNEDIYRTVLIYTYSCIKVNLPQV